MTIQHSRITVEVDLAYDDDRITEHGAQEAFIEHGITEGFVGVEVHFFKVTHGLVDADGVPVKL